MKKHLASALIAFSLALSGPATAQPWLECAEKALPKVSESETRDLLRGSLARGYARNGEFAHAQALIDSASGEAAHELGIRATIGAAEGDHIQQALRWAPLYISPKELSWSSERQYRDGSERERLLQAAKTPESAAQLLAFLQSHGGVSPASLGFAIRDIGGLPYAVSDYYLREFEKIADQATPLDWVQLEGVLEAAGEEFAPLRARVLPILLDRREDLVDQLVTTNNLPRAQVENGMVMYAAILLARQGRFKEADEMWNRVAANAGKPERKEYLQNQYLGGRQEALAELAEVTGLEEDAKVEIAKFMRGLGHYEKAKALGTDPAAYDDWPMAERDLERGKNIDQSLAVAVKLDEGALPTDSRLYVLALDPEMPALVREKATALLPNPQAARQAFQAHLLDSLKKLSDVKAEDLTVRLLMIDQFMAEAGCGPSEEGLKLIEAACAKTR